MNVSWIVCRYEVSVCSSSCRLLHLTPASATALQHVEPPLHHYSSTLATPTIVIIRLCCSSTDHSSTLCCSHMCHQQTTSAHVISVCSGFLTLSTLPTSQPASMS